MPVPTKWAFRKLTRCAKWWKNRALARLTGRMASISPSQIAEAASYCTARLIVTSCVLSPTSPKAIIEKMPRKVASELGSSTPRTSTVPAPIQPSSSASDAGEVVPLSGADRYINTANSKKRPAVRRSR